MCCSYLIFGAFATVLGLAAVAFLTRSREFLIAAGILAAPTGLADALFVPEYWTPNHIFSKNFSVEGVLFSFGNGVLVAAMPAVFWPRFQINGSANLLGAMLRCSTLMLFGIFVFFAFWQHGFGSLMIMHAAFVGFTAMFATLAWIGWLSGLVALSGGVGFCLIYLVQTTVLMWIDPSAIQYWSADSYMGLIPFWPHLPIEEFAWAFLYGALWASLMVYGFDIPVKKPSALTKT